MEAKFQLQQNRNLGAGRSLMVITAPRQLCPWEGPRTHCTGGWVGFGTPLERKRKSRLNGDSIPRPFITWRIALPTALSQPSLPLGSVKINIERSFENSEYTMQFSLAPCSVLPLRSGYYKYFSHNQHRQYRGKIMDSEDGL